MNRRGVFQSRAFTIVELLIVIAVIIMLMSILIVAVNAATRTAQGANTRSLMNSVKQGLARFRGDFGYLPPVLGRRVPVDLNPESTDLRRLFDPRGDDLQWSSSSTDDILPEGPDGAVNANYRENVQEWYSVTTLAEYLLGYGHHQQDGYGYIPPALGGPLYDGSPGQPDERPPTGIRNPGSDGVWGATINGSGGLADRMQGQSANIDVGQVYGPYIDLKDDRLLAGVNYDPVRGEVTVAFPGDAAFDPYGPMALVDYWGTPIRYYRRLYAPGDLRAPYHRRSRTLPGQEPRPEPTLSDVFLLRPFKVDPGNAIDATLADNSANGGDTTTTVALNSAEFALFSAGPDRTFDPTVRYDAQDYNDDGVDFSNEDNIVELGP